MDRDPDEIYRELTPAFGTPSGCQHSLAAICFSDRWDPAPDALMNNLG
jgi:hypothetical protein